MQDSTRKGLLKFSQALIIPVTVIMFTAMLVPPTLNPILRNIPWFSTVCGSVGLGNSQACYPQLVLFILSAVFFLAQCLITGHYIMSPSEQAEANRNE